MEKIYYRESFMGMKLLILLSFIMCVPAHLLGQNQDKGYDTRKELQETVFQRNQISINEIHLRKATFDLSTDEIGWVSRIETRSFGFPDFEKNMVEEIYSRINSQREDTVMNKTELYHSFTTEIVDGFFTEEDQDYMVQQIKSAKRDQWDPSKYNHLFSDTATAIKISEPYYNLDKTKAIVFVISPILERAEFYRKVGGKWEYYFGSLLWIE